MNLKAVLAIIAIVSIGTGALVYSLFNQSSNEPIPELPTTPTPKIEPTPSPEETPTPTTTPEPTSTPSNIFSGYEWKVIKGQVNFTEQGLKITTPQGHVLMPVEQNTIVLVNSVPSYNDYTIEADIVFLNKGYRAGILFRYLDPSSYYSFEIGSEYNEIDIIKYSSVDPNYGELRTYVDIPSGNSTLTIDPGVSYHLTVKVSQNVFTGYINGNEVISFIDNSYQSGLVGIKARCSDVLVTSFVIKY